MGEERKQAGETLIGKQLGPYQIVDQLGQGGMATVYKAYQSKVDRYVALKMLPQNFADDPDYARRFAQEAKILAKLQHPHILQVYDYGEVDGHTFIVMPFIQSGTLATLLRGTPLPVREIRHIIEQIGDALDYAHSQGLVHRDVKPSNVLLDERGNCLLADFGIAKIMEETTKLTGTGGIIGTPIYMSPEQGQGQNLDGRSDIYSLGVMLYEMATGQLPFTATSRMAIVIKHLYDAPPPPCILNPNLPKALEEVILKSLNKKPESRYATAARMVRALQAVTLDAILIEMTTIGDTTVPSPGRAGPIAISTAPASKPSQLKTMSPDQLSHMLTSHLRYGWVADPWHEKNPYNFLAGFSIGSGSSMLEIQGHLSTQMAEPQRIAWQQLHDLSSRLFVDSFLYRATQHRELIALVKTHLSVNDQLPSIEQVPSALQNEWPLILLLAGQREDSIATWAEIRQAHQDQTNPLVIHSLAVAHTFLAQRQEQTEQVTTAITSWRRAIAHWAWILANDDFWTDWAASRSRCYQMPVTTQHVANLRQQLQDHLSNRFVSGSRALPPDCPLEIRQTYEELSLEWRIEWAGLQALKQLRTTLTVSQTVNPEVGPLLATELGLAESLAEFTRECTRAVDDIVFILTSSLDGDQVRQNVQNVRLYFSQLGRARAWLDYSQPERALAAVPAAQEALDFNQLNPPYRLLPDKQGMWFKDSATLAMRAHLQLANAHLQREPWPIEAIVAQWTEIISLGASSNETDLAISMIQQQSLAYIQTIAATDSGQHQQLLLAEATKQFIGLTPRLEIALKKLRRSLRKSPAGEIHPLETSDLETVLINMIKPRPQQITTSWQVRAEKLYAVLQVNPTDEIAREQLARLLVEQLKRLIDEEQVETARRIVNEWYVKLNSHPLLRRPYYYLKHGYKVALYLPQTDLVYNTSLLQPYTHRFGFHLEYADFFVELKVEGDLVRISAPFLGSAELSNLDIQRNLLQVTWAMPLYKVYREPSGEYGLLIETLANALTPTLLEQLVRSLASRVDLSQAHLNSLGALQQMMNRYAPDLSVRAGVPPTKPDFENWQSQLLTVCQQLGLECMPAGDFVYRLKRRAASGEPILLDFQAPAVTFQVYVAEHYHLHPDLYQQMMDWNRSTELCKLTLDPDKAVELRCEVLDLDDQETLARILTLILEGLAQVEAFLFL